MFLKLIYFGIGLHSRMPDVLILHPLGNKRGQFGMDLLGTKARRAIRRMGVMTSIMTRHEAQCQKKDQNEPRARSYCK